MRNLYIVESVNFMSGPLNYEDAITIATYAMVNINFMPTIGNWREGYEPSENWKLRLAHNLRNRIDFENQWHSLPSETVSKIRELYQKLWDEAMVEI